MNDTDTIVAIDPGSRSGALAVLAKGRVCVINMPSSPEGIFNMLRDIKNNSVPQIILERVGTSRPGNSARAAHTFAVHQGHLEMACIALQAPMIKVLPQQWMKDLFEKSWPKGANNKRQRKLYVYDKMRQIFPNVNFSIRQADALAILYWFLKKFRPGEQV